MQFYSVTVMTNVMALIEVGQSDQGTFEPIAPVQTLLKITVLVFLGNHFW